MSFKLVLTQNFTLRLKEESERLHQIWEDEYTQDVANERLLVLETEIKSSLAKISTNPRLFSALDDADQDTRGKTVHHNRFRIVWVISEKNNTVTLTDFQDLKYPLELRYQEINFDEED